MKLLLINTPIETDSILGNFSGIYNDLKMIPTGLAYLASSARNRGIDVSIVDQYAELLPPEELERRIGAFSPDLLGFGSTTPNYQAALALLKFLRSIFPRVKTVMGGNHPSVFPDSVLANPEVDFVLRGEAEHSLPKLCMALTGSHKLEDIPGLSFRDQNGSSRHNPHAEIIDLTELPWPAYDLLPMHLYSSPSYTRFAHPIFQMIASRGCPNNCTYCINAAEPKLGATYRQRPIDDVINEMYMLRRKFGARQIQFWDPIFPLGKKHAEDFCKKLIRSGLHEKIVWNSTTYPDFLDEETIALMVRAGCRGLGFGIETGVPALLRTVNKRTSLRKAREACKTARKHGLTVLGSFILGFPGETREMTRQTIEFAKSLDLHYAQFSILIPYPGTPLYQNLRAKGEISSPAERDFHRYNQSVGLTDSELIYTPAGRTSSELKNWQKRAYQEFYLRPKMIMFHLRIFRWGNLAHLMKSLGALLRMTLKSLIAKFHG